MTKLRKLFVCLMFCGACGADKTISATQLLVKVDSDLTVGEQLSKVELEVRGSDGTRADQHVFTLTTGKPSGKDQVRLPFTFGIQRRGADALQIVITGLDKNDKPVVERKLKAQFRAQRTLNTTVFLSKVCFEKVCDDDAETCAIEASARVAAGDCAAIPSAVLTESTSGDAGVADAGAMAGATGRAGTAAAGRGGAGAAGRAGGTGGVAAGSGAVAGGIAAAGSGGNGNAGGWAMTAGAGGLTATAGSPSAGAPSAGAGGTPVCTPKCDGKECGPNGCGGDCSPGCNAAAGGVCSDGVCKGDCGAVAVMCNCGVPPSQTPGTEVLEPICATGTAVLLGCTEPPLYCNEPGDPVSYAWGERCTCDYP